MRPSRHPPGTSPLVVGTAGWNWLINRVVPPRWYIPANVAAAAVATGWAVANEIPLARLGVVRSHPARGLRYGLVGAAVAAAGIALASRLDATASLFDDARADGGHVAFEALVRIPLGTVVLEEILFRGALPVVLGPGRAAASFGAWHIVPALATLDANGIDDAAQRKRAVVGAVIATTAAAGPLWWLRRRSGSLLAPMLAHWSTNATAYALAAQRRRSPRNDQHPDAGAGRAGTERS